MYLQFLCRENYRRDVILLKRRDLFAILAAGAAIAVAAQALYRWVSGESGYESDEDYDCDEQEELEDEALDELLDETYDEGFADGLNCDYQGRNPAAQALQAELNDVLDECVACQCGISDELGEESGEPEDGKSPEGQQAE